MLTSQLVIKFFTFRASVGSENVIYLLARHLDKLWFSCDFGTDNFRRRK